MLEATPSAQWSGRLPGLSQSRRALCKANMCSRVINWIGREWGGCPRGVNALWWTPRTCHKTIRAEGVPLDRKPRELTIHQEGWNGHVAGGERFPKGSIEYKLHARRFK